MYKSTLNLLGSKRDMMKSLASAEIRDHTPFSIPGGFKVLMFFTICRSSAPIQVNKGVNKVEDVKKTCS